MSFRGVAYCCRRIACCSQAGRRATPLKPFALRHQAKEDGVLQKFRKAGYFKVFDPGDERGDVQSFESDPYTVRPARSTAARW